MTVYVAPDAVPVSRHSVCGSSYNPYRYAECPRCHVTNGGAWLGCPMCRHEFLAPADDDRDCPRCGWGVLEPILERDDAP